MCDDDISKIRRIIAYGRNAVQQCRLKLRVRTSILLYYGAVQQDELKSLLQNGVSATVEVL